MLRICYIDAGLRGNTGHYANSCRHITGALRKMGHQVDAFAHRTLPPDLAREIPATPYLRNDPYAPVVPFNTRLSHKLAQASFLNDLGQIWRGGPYDIIYINSVLAPELAGIVAWLKKFPPQNAPFVAAEFGGPSGLNLSQTSAAHRFFMKHTAFYARAIRTLPSPHAQNLLLFTFDPLASAEYASLLGRAVLTMPAIHTGLHAPRPRATPPDGQPVVAFLGHQRDEKGYFLVPGIIRHLRESGTPARFLVHNGAPEACETDRILAAMANDDAWLSFEHRPADQLYWQAILDRADLIVLPYEPQRYAASYSAVAYEAASDAIPMVAPAATTMAALGETYETGMVTFAAWDAPSIAAAVRRALVDFDALAGQALSGAAAWRAANGPAAFVDRLLAARPATQPPSGHSNAAPVMTAALDVMFMLRNAAKFFIQRK
jgi:glycosyltransferase involved in cell wall biosynthesis